METRTHYNRIAGGDVGRLEALSDGIFAFAATVLVLDFHTPDAADIHTEAQLLGALATSAPRLLPWLVSLITLGIFWVGQQTGLNQLERSNRDLTWLHFVFLAVVTVVPFTTRLLADFFTYRTAFVIYWANILLLGASLYATWAYAEWAKLIREDAHGEISRAIKRRIVLAQSLYAVGAVVGLFDVTLGIALIMLIQLNYAMAPRLPFLWRL
ncbi:MAG TPA: TMEM175 family protein [Roseiarcus sp.]|nr:TMEM175 family protein [Roseiarcus sp.]